MATASNLLTFRTQFAAAGNAAPPPGSTASPPGHISSAGRYDAANSTSKPECLVP